MSTNPEQPEPVDSKGGTARTLLFLLLGPSAWAAHHMAMYASHTLICALAIGGDSVAPSQSMRTVAVIATASALALGAAPLLVPDALRRALAIQPGTDWSFYRGATALLSILAVTGIAWNGGLTLLTPASSP